MMRHLAQFSILIKCEHKYRDFCEAESNIVQTTTIYNHMKKQYCMSCQTSCGEIVGADILFINNQTLLCIVDYYSKFPVLNRADRLPTYYLIRAAKIVFTIFGLQKSSIRCRYKLPCQTNLYNFAGS